jgi:hypothetical protein
VLSGHRKFLLLWACALLLGVASARSASACGNAGAGLAVPPGFCASVFAEGLGHARHLAVAPNGDVYVNTWSSPPPATRTRPAATSSRCAT